MSVSPARRALAGAVLLDFAVSPLFIWDAFSASLARDLRVSVPSLSLAFSVGLAAFTAGVLVGGRVADAVAPRRIAVLTGCGVVVGLGTAAVAPSLLVLIVGFGIVLGGATGLGYATAVRVAGTVTAGRGGAMALVVSAYAAGAVVLAPVADRLLAVAGRAGMFASLAVGLGVVVVCAAILLPGTPPPARVAPRGGAAVVRLFRVPVPALWTMFFLGSAPALIAFAHAGQFAGRPQLTVVAVSLINAGNFVGRLIAGPASDRLGHAPVLHATAAALAGSCLALAVAPDNPAVTLTALLVLGTQYGALSVLTPVATAEAVPNEQFGTAYGMVFSGWGIAGLAGPVAAAWLATRTGYPAIAAVLVGVAALSWVAVLWASASVRRVRQHPRPHHLA
ncbi:MAG: MFS transporter [Pseudonocardiaceae bacterium]|nr:MFS transporter [Pseudonocardiaceae bacterium]